MSSISEQYKRRDKVNFKGNERHRPVNNVYVWANHAHDDYDAVIIEHPQGFPKGYFDKKNHTRVSREAHRLLQTGLRYIYVSNENELEKV